MSFSVTYDSSNGISSGSTASAAHVNQNFSDIETELNAFPTDGALADGAVSTAAKLASNVVTTAKILDANVTTAKIANDAVDADKLAADSVVDGSIVKTGSFSLFGTWATTDSEGTALAAYKSGDTAVVYQAQTDGFVCVDAVGTASAGNILGKTDSSSPPTTTRICTGSGSVVNHSAFTMPVKKSDYWLVEYSTHFTSVVVSWLPIGTGSCVKQ
jgi:hypothetical protein